MSIEELRTPILEVGGAGLVSLITWLFSSRRRLADVKKVELENEQTATKIYKELCDELRGEMDEMRHQIKLNNERIRQLEQENCDLRLEVHELKMNRWAK